MRKIDEATRRAVVELEQLFADYWEEVDVNASRSAPEFFTEDCVFQVQEREFRGRAGVRAFYDDRAASRPVRTTRHTTSNFRVILETPTRAQVSFVSVTFGADGHGPITNFDGPSLVAQMRSVCVKDAEEIWRIQRFQAAPIFIGSEAYTRSVLIPA